jgi:ceramide glucosyltransferase
MWYALLALALLGTVSSTVFLILALVGARRYRRYSEDASRSANAVPESSLPPVTLLKPVHGMEPRLRENLESFFRQDYSDFEIIFGARSADNAALGVVDELRALYPNVKCRIVLSGPPTWPNAKVFSLDKMTALARNDFFVISDSDVEVGPDFLQNVVPPLLDPRNGLLTCVYRGVPAPSFWSSLEALGMSVEMTSGVLVADMLEGMRFALGAVSVTRREVLERIGGIGVTADYYSDDFVLGNLVWAAGYNVVLSHYIVDHILIPSSFLRTFGHQVRWMKSTRYSRPRGHLGSGLTFAVPFGLLAMISGAALAHPVLGLALLGGSILNRMIQSLAIGWSVARDPRALRLCWLYPLRDLLGFITWAASYTSRSFFWRGETYQFTPGGKIVPQQRAVEDALVNQP